MSFLKNIMTAEQIEADRLSKLAKSERGWRDAELLKADIEVNKATDTANPTESSWRQYREALRHWPASEYFPSQASRPIAPTPGDAA